MIRNLMRGTALGFALTLPLFSSAAIAQIAVSANDNKIALVDGVNTVPANPPPDTVTIVDIGVSPPKVLGELQAPSSVVGTSTATCLPSITALNAARTAISVLPKPTSPQISRSIGTGFSMSAFTSSIAVS